ncbi:hypothetical protein T484DRAFT_1859112 [Baffinella frigidus]|nr:hypothetical protein T484DRAFT_1859112 [Cryptophyta sp. CCMP2293]
MATVPVLPFSFDAGHFEEACCHIEPCGPAEATSFPSIIIKTPRVVRASTKGSIRQNRSLALNRSASVDPPKSTAGSQIVRCVSFGAESAHSPTRAAPRRSILKTDNAAEPPGKGAARCAHHATLRSPVPSFPHKTTRPCVAVASSSPQNVGREERDDGSDDILFSSPASHKLANDLVKTIESWRSTTQTQSAAWNTAVKDFRSTLSRLLVRDLPPTLPSISEEHHGLRNAPPRGFLFKTISQPDPETPSNQGPRMRRNLSTPPPHTPRRTASLPAQTRPDSGQRGTPFLPPIIGTSSQPASDSSLAPTLAWPRRARPPAGALRITRRGANPFD